MSDLYVEQLVKRKMPSSLVAARVGMIVLTVFSVLVLFIMPPLIILPIILVVLDIFLFNRWNVEYEYLFVNGGLDVDKIMGQSKRKKQFEMEANQLEIMAPLGYAELKNYERKSLKTYNFTSLENEKDVYVMIVNQNNTQVKVLIEPNKQIVEEMKLRAPRKVYMQY